ncbi:asparagine synthase-related protein [Natronogracilivirga saccharolytica]|uniref:asparagine synthase (glutamine-hydrolyzing) n=1 Tax=Natronogracilivirga saccharolytica TaxID=2812953 RepID=A0A8J7RVS9_9BACT|nr:asparagine synthase-related protein [Natronogracilivirga saccharolytica]MBP3193857.1 hypothetical protein [Natronogracilivirga saccharolytica]
MDITVYYSQLLNNLNSNKRNITFNVSVENTDNINEYTLKKYHIYILGNAKLAHVIEDEINHERLLSIKNELQNTVGNFAVIIIGSNKLHVITDVSGSIPLYYGITQNCLALSTKPEKVAEKIGNPEFDNVSIADFIVNETICHPYTTYQNIYAIDPGSINTFTDLDMESESYYKPIEETSNKNLEDWAFELRNMVRDSVHENISDKKNIRVLFSGGEDARVVTSFIPKAYSCKLTTILDFKNREYALANMVARTLNRPLEWVQRPAGFYRNNFKERIELIGSGRDIRHTHLFGDTAKPYENSDLLLGGYAADTLFKTAWMKNTGYSFKGAGPERMYPYNPDDISGVHSPDDLAWLHKDLAYAIWERRWKFHLRFKEIRPLTAGNWHTLWPMGTHRTTYPHYLSTLRVGPKLIEPFLDNRVYQLAAAMPDKFRIDRKVFRKAFRKSLGIAAFVPGSNNRIPAIGGTLGSLARLAIISNRKIIDKITSRQGIQESFGKDTKGFNFSMNDFFNSQSLNDFNDIIRGEIVNQNHYGIDLDMISSKYKVRLLQTLFVINK